MPVPLFPRRGPGYAGTSMTRLRDVEKTAVRRSVPQQLRAVSEARKRIFGYACGMPGEEQWLKPLEGRERVKWYWPCKYLFQNFHVGQYFHVQALRYSPRSTHPSIHELAECLELCWRKRKAIRFLLSKLDRRKFEENQSLQDLYAMYRTLRNDEPLPFSVNPLVWTDSGFSWMNLPTPGDTDTAAEAPEEAGTVERTDAVNLRVKDLPYLSLRQEHSMREFVTALPFTSEGGVTSQPRKFDQRSSSSRSPGASSGVLSSRRDKSSSGIGRGKQDNAHECVSKQDASKGKHIVSDGSSKISRTRSRHCLLALAEANTANATPASGSVKRSTVGLAPPFDAAEEKLLLNRQQESKRALEKALVSDEELAKYHGAKHRFFDPLFRRKRLSFLDRFARDRIKGEIARQLGTQLYVQHPDHKETWPDNKGLITRKWPSPYH